MLGTAAADITITDLAVHPTSRNSFVAVMRGQGPAAQPALLRVDGAGKIDLVSFEPVKFTSVTLPNPPAVNPNPNARGGRASSVTDMALVNGRLVVAGLSNEEFASKLWSVPYPFATTDRGASVEIYHGNHGALETRSPVMAFVPYTIDNQLNIVAGYTCTPLVKFPVSSLKPGEKIVGTTIAEFGAGNQPLDLFLYKKDGKDFLLMSNSRHGVMKISTAPFGSARADHRAGRRHRRRAVRADRGDDQRRADGPARRAADDRDFPRSGRRPQPDGRHPAVDEQWGNGAMRQ